MWAELAALLREPLATGARAEIVATKATLLREEWLGTSISEEMLSNFESRGMDACGERGEHHTLAFASSRMSAPLTLREIGRLMHDSSWMPDLGLH